MNNYPSVFDLFLVTSTSSSTLSSSLIEKLTTNQPTFNINQTNVFNLSVYFIICIIVAISICIGITVFGIIFTVYWKKYSRLNIETQQLKRSSPTIFHSITNDLDSNCDLNAGNIDTINKMIENNILNQSFQINETS